MFYTYLWLRENGTPYYVGKGSYLKRATEGHKVGKSIRRAPKKDFILIQEFETEVDAFFAEKFLIACYGRKDCGTGILRNQTDGGEGATGPSEGHRKQARALRGRPFSELHCQKISLAKMGNTARLGQRNTHCKAGHDLSGDNLRITSRGHHTCWICTRALDQVYYQRRKYAASQMFPV